MHTTAPVPVSLTPRPRDLTPALEHAAPEALYALVRVGGWDPRAVAPLSGRRLTPLPSE